MKTILGLVFAFTITAHATIIPVDLGPPRNFVQPDVRVPINLGFSKFSGQSLSLDFTFTNNEFLRLYPAKHYNFEVFPWLLVSGTGTMNSPSGEAWTVGVNGERNSAISTFSAVSLTDDGSLFALPLGYIFPYFADSTGKKFNTTYPFDIYSLHFDLLLGNNPDFQIESATLFLGGAGSRSFGIGPHVPDSGASILLFAMGLGAIGIFQCRGLRSGNP
jgi:hypothetical protein